MSSEPIIQIENLGKKYILKGSQISKEKSLLEQLAFWNRRSQEKEFWALQGLNYSIDRGQTTGIVGSNGSGKSTLLKILSRVTKPTTGYVKICGRVSALLEVGTGFHLELSGRENIFLSGAMLGMKRAEIIQHFDAIVDFAGIHQFLDVPVKRYSSGMFLRLAFAVMSHLKNEILIIDEILAVGDANFQAKCLAKMQAITQEGRTILLVSHQLDKIQALCQQTVWIHQGHLLEAGPTERILNQYRESLGQTEISSNCKSDIPQESLL